MIAISGTSGETGQYRDDQSEFSLLVDDLREVCSLTDQELALELGVHAEDLHDFVNGRADTSELMEPVRELAVSGRTIRKRGPKRFSDTAYGNGGSRFHTLTAPSPRNATERAAAVSELISHITVAAERPAGGLPKSISFQLTLASGQQFSIPPCAAIDLHREVSVIDPTLLLNWLCGRRSARYSATFNAGRSIVRTVQMNVFSAPAA